MRTSFPPAACSLSLPAGQCTACAFVCLPVCENPSGPLLSNWFSISVTHWAAEMKHILMKHFGSCCLTRWGAQTFIYLFFILFYLICCHFESHSSSYDSNLSISVWKHLHKFRIRAHCVNVKLYYLPSVLYRLVSFLLECQYGNTWS